MTPTRHARRTASRMRICMVAIAFVLSLFAARLFQLQGLDANAYASMATAEGSASVPLHASRGAVLDRFGFELASTVDAVALTADPTMTSAQAPAVAAILTRHLRLDYFATVTKLRRPESRFVYLDRRVPTWRANAVMADLEAARLPGVFTERDPLRTYPGDEIAANVVGLVGADGAGLAGLEQQYDEQLSGVDGQATYVVSPAGERIPLADASVQQPQPGVAIQTTIDRDVQWYTDRRLHEAVIDTRSDWGAVISLDVRTGQIIQFSQYPTFDPNVSAKRDTDKLSARGVQNVYEPGSVEKILTFAALSDAGQVTPRTKIKVPGALWIDGHEVNDDWSHGMIRLTATGVLAKSSNLGTVLASRRVSDETLYDYLRNFGLGDTTGVGLPGESRGLLPVPSIWADISHATIAFGQGLSVTVVQMAAAVAAVANGGTYIQPSLVSGFVEADGSVTPAPEPATHRVVSERAARQVSQMLEAVVLDGGTAPLAAIPGYRVAGKTGTAQRVNPQSGRYVAGERTISFAGFAPADEPRFMTYVVLDNPKDGSFGGTAAAPVFQDVMSMLLQRYGVAPTGTKQPSQALEW